MSVRIRGVELSVAGGEFHVANAGGTVPAVIVWENVIVSMPSESVVRVSPSAGMSPARLVVPAV